MHIHLVTGKGGVGKSVFSLAFALHQATQAKTLLVELGEESFFRFVFDSHIEYAPTSIRVGDSWLDMACWNGEEALSEYVLHLIKVEKLHRLFFENPVSRSLVDAAPGLKELAILGKVTSGPPRNVGPKLPYDVLVVDCYSSGHFLSMVKAPKAMAETFRMGPMSEQSLSIMRVLENPDITQIHCVTLPEELPVQETLELLESLRSLFPKTPVQVWLNKWVEYPTMTHPSTELETYLQEQAQLQERFFQQLIGRYPAQTKRLPFVPEVEAHLMALQLKQAIQKGGL